MVGGWSEQEGVSSDGGEVVDSVSRSEFSVGGGGANSDLGLRYDGYAVVIDFSC